MSETQRNDSINRAAPAAGNIAENRAPVPASAVPAPTVADARAIAAATHWGSLAIIREDGTPTIRPIGSFAPAATGAQVDIYFSTPRESAKSLALRRNPKVNFYLQPAVTNPAAYRAVSLIGEAAEVPPGTPDYAAAIVVLSAKSAIFKARADSGDLARTAIYRIRATELRHSDYSRSHAITEIPVA